MMLRCKIARVREERQEGKERKGKNGTGKTYAHLEKIGNAREVFFFFFF